MSRKYINFEITLIYLLLLIPWPQTHIIKIFCSKDNSRLVRKIVRSKWTPILDKYSVKLPLECPLHPQRDIFAPRQDAKKRDRPTQWTCRLCGKSFYQEKYLDLHFETRHKSIINEAEDAVCLADFCDVMRCDVFHSEEASSLKIGDQHIVTDIEVWGDSLGQNSALAKANAAYLSLIPLRTSSVGGTRTSPVQSCQLCQDKIGQNKFKDTVENFNAADNKPTKRTAAISNDGAATTRKKSHTADGGRTTAATGTATTTTTTNSKSTMHHNAANNLQTPPQKQSSNRETAPAQTTTSSRRRSPGNDNGSDNEGDQNGDGDGDDGGNGHATATGNGNRTQNGHANMQRMRANCKADELSKLKATCEQMLHGCIGSLILSLSDQAFKEMEEEMNKAVCWYLSCDRYWEDGPLELRAFPWGLILILILVLSTGVCFCYYIIWILFDTEETTINANHHVYMYQHPYQQQQQQHHQVPLHQHQRQHQASYPTTGMIGGHQQAVPQPYYYQQSVHDLYPELPQYDYRHSPRRYIDDTHPSAGTPMGATATSAASVHGGTPLHHHRSHHHQQQQQQQQQQQHTPKQSHAYPQDTLDRRDYISRPIATTAVTGGGNASYGKTAGGASTSAAGAAAAASSANDGAVGGMRHYNTHPRPLATHHRHTGASQQSLRTSASTHEIIQNDMGQNEHYIYVTYPPDLKKRYYEYDK